MNFTVCQSNSNVLKAKTVNVVNDGSNIVCVSCGKDVFMLSHKKCVARYALSVDYRVKRALFTCPIVEKSRNLGATAVVAKSKFSIDKTLTATNKVIQLVLWIVDSGCSKHMTGNLYLVRNFLEKFIGTVRFENDHFTAITRYGDYVQGNLTICHGEDLLTGSRDSNLYTISISKLAASSPMIILNTPRHSLSSLIVVEEDEAPQMIASSEDPVANEPITPVLTKNANEPVQEDVAAFDRNDFYNPF
ncbi:hypothetical protein Tco_0918738 [Tanacetum coccineum]